MINKTNPLGQLTGRQPEAFLPREDRKQTFIFQVNNGETNRLAPLNNFSVGSRWKNNLSYTASLGVLQPDALQNLDITNWKPFFSRKELETIFSDGTIPTGFNETPPPLFQIESENEGTPKAVMKGYIPPSISREEIFHIAIATADRFDDYSRLFVHTTSIDGQGNETIFPQIVPGVSKKFGLRHEISLPMGFSTQFDVACDYKREGNVDIVDMDFIPGSAKGRLITCGAFHARLMISPYKNGGSILTCEISFNIHVFGAHLPIDRIVKSMLEDSTQEFCRDFSMAVALYHDKREPTEYMQKVGG